MKEIEIADVQNIAKNMIVGSKQHSLFKSVINNNPNLISNNSTAPEYGEAKPAGEEGLEISKVSIDKGNGESFTAISIAGSAKPGCCSDSGGKGVGMGANLVGGIDMSPKGLNSELYGMLKPCKKQFNTGNDKRENNEDKSEY